MKRIFQSIVLLGAIFALARQGYMDVQRHCLHLQL